MNYFIGLIALAIGGSFGYWLRRQVAINKATSAENKAEKIIDEAKVKEKEILLKLTEKVGSNILNQAIEFEHNME